MILLVEPVLLLPSYTFLYIFLDSFDTNLIFLFVDGRSLIRKIFFNPPRNTLYEQTVHVYAVTYAFAICIQEYVQCI